MPNLKFIDISHYQKVTSFAQIKAAGIIGVILKATQGAGMVDITYADKRAAAKAAGLEVGAYCFCTNENPTEQVAHFLSVAKPDDRLLMAADWEDYGNLSMSLTQIKDFLGELEKELGRLPKLYSGNRVKDLLGNTKDADLGRYPLWIPQYGPKAVLQASWTSYFGWQYSESGKVAGVSGNAVDLNTTELSDEELIKQWV